MQARGFQVLMLDMRGHGQSEAGGHTFGARERLDVLGAWDWLRAQGFEAGMIGLLGVSMGAAASIGALALEPEIRAVIADGGYADLPALIGNRWPTTAPGLVDDGTHAEAHRQRADIDFEEVAGGGVQPLGAQPVEIEIALAQLQAELAERIVEFVAQRVEVDDAQQVSSETTQRTGRAGRGQLRRVNLKRGDGAGGRLRAGHDAGERNRDGVGPVSYTHLRAHETVLDLVCRLLLEKKKDVQ